MGDLTRDQLSQILEEISKYEVELESDPTLPHLKNIYLQRVTALCRTYQNRIMFYLQKVKVHEKNVRLSLHFRMADLEFKTKELLADNPTVRNQPSIRDRESIAATMLAAEHRAVTDLKIELLDVEETYKLIKLKYDQLRQTANDIRLQRSLVRDDLTERLGGSPGYEPPSKQGPQRTGLPPPVTSVSAADLVDPSKRPEDMPPPVNEGHARQMAAFLNAFPDRQSEPVPPDELGLQELLKAPEPVPEKAPDTPVAPEKGYFESLLD